MAALADKNEDVRKSAAEALGKIGPATPEVVPALVRALKDKKEDVRSEAGDALAQIGLAGKEAIPALWAVWKSDPSAFARNAAGRALQAMGEKVEWK